MQVLDAHGAVLFAYGWEEETALLTDALEEALGVSPVVEEVAGDGGHFGPHMQYTWDGMWISDYAAFSGLERSTVFVPLDVSISVPAINGVALRTVEGVAVGMPLEAGIGLGLQRTGDGFYASDPLDPQDFTGTVMVGVGGYDPADVIDELWFPAFYAGNL